MHLPYRLALVIPCYNEAKRLLITQMKAYIESPLPFKDFFFVFVNDGSTDDTEIILRSFQKQYPSKIHIHTLATNQGKAEAIRQAMIWVQTNMNVDVVGFMDADLSTPLAEVEPLVQCFANTSYQIVIGSRKPSFSNQITKHALRHYIGRGIAWLINQLFGFGIYDTQCGAKFFYQRHIPVLFEKRFLSTWIFDVEMLLRYQQSLSNKALFATHVKELTLQTWTHVAGSKVPYSYFAKMFYELCVLKLSFRRT